MLAVCAETLTSWMKGPFLKFGTRDWEEVMPERNKKELEDKSPPEERTAVVVSL